MWQVFVLLLISPVGFKSDHLFRIKELENILAEQQEFFKEFKLQQRKAIEKARRRESILMDTETLHQFLLHGFSEEFTKWEVERSKRNGDSGLVWGDGGREGIKSGECGMI